MSWNRKTQWRFAAILSAVALGAAATFAAFGQAWNSDRRLPPATQEQLEEVAKSKTDGRPVAIVTPGYPVLGLAARDAAEASVADMAHKLAGQGALAFLTSDRPGAAKALPFAATGHPLTDPLALIVSFYGFVETLSRHRGLNPDVPPALKKVTETV